MRRVTSITIFLVALSLALAACQPVATPPPVAQPTETEEAMTAPQPTETEEVLAEPQPTPAPVEPVTEGTMLVLPEIFPDEFSGDIYAAGSSTVFPLTEKVVELFKAEGYDGKGNIKIDSIGSGAGFERFCKTGESDIANASRGIKDSEVESCRAINREPIEFRVGTDAIAIVTNKNNTWLTNVTLEELAKIFSNEVEQWSEVNPAWPAETIKRYAPGTDSGTFDFFVEEVMESVYGDTGTEVFLQASNLQPSEDDNVLVQGVAGDEFAIGFFGFAFFQENSDILNILMIDDVLPTFETAESGEYALARPLYIYSDASLMEAKPQVAAFINFYLSNVNRVIDEVGYFPASEEALNQAKQAWLDATK